MYNQPSLMDEVPPMPFLVILLLALAQFAVAAVPRPAPVWEYPLAEDGGLVYKPLTREAQKTGQWALYENVPMRSATLEAAGYKLTFNRREKRRPMTRCPSNYTLSWEEGSQPAFPVYVEATAFEDNSRRKGRDLFDLALPGKLALDVEYLGSVTAHIVPGRRNVMKPDFSDEPGHYPSFDTRPLTRSGVVEAGDLVWFKFRFTNTGDTILDPEGFGAWLLNPELLRKDEAGEFRFLGQHYNLYIRDLEYLYPGESHETWVSIVTQGAKETPQNLGLAPGEYKLRFRSQYRRYKDENWMLNMWEGAWMTFHELPFTVEKEARQTPVAPIEETLSNGGEEDKLTRWIHSFEEFMTTFEGQLAAPKDPAVHSISGTLGLQVAPWTKHVVVKLVTTGPVACKSLALPVDVSDASLRVTFDPDHQANVIQDGLRYPAIYSQTMSDMRQNVQLGPYPEQHLLASLRQMRDCGINVVATTSMPWLYEDFGETWQVDGGEERSNQWADGLKYFLDQARREGLQVEGWGSYPFDRYNIGPIAEWISGRQFPMERQGIQASHASRNLILATDVMWRYNFRRWGDLYFQLEDGTVPISVEDSRGWMRQDVNTRYPEGTSVIKLFRKWAEQKYGDLAGINAAWDTEFASLEEIDPEANQVRNAFGHLWEYTDPAHPFHDWNQAVLDWDAFRTDLRLKNYADTLERFRRVVPGAKITLRTEGANVMVSGLNPEDPNPHLRHIWYSQRRTGAIAEQLQASGLIAFHSDYTTIPYTPSEVAWLTSQAVEQGIVPCWFPQFDNMRDIAINERWGTDYRIAYNLPEPRQGAMMHVLTAAYPWFKAVYENGGVPGILWADYQCDGYVTETQARELKLFRKQLEQALSTPEARKARAQGLEQPDQTWRSQSLAKPSFMLED